MSWKRSQHSLPHFPAFSSYLNPVGLSSAHNLTSLSHIPQPPVFSTWQSLNNPDLYALWSDLSIALSLSTILFYLELFPELLQYHALMRSSQSFPGPSSSKWRLPQDLVLGFLFSFHLLFFFSTWTKSVGMTSRIVSLTLPLSQTPELHVQLPSSQPILFVFDSVPF